MKLPGLNSQILLGALLGLALGWGMGALEPDSAVRSYGLYASGLVGGIFIDLLKMILVPLVFTLSPHGSALLMQGSVFEVVGVTSLVAIGLALFSFLLSHAYS